MSYEKSEPRIAGLRGRIAVADLQALKRQNNAAVPDRQGIGIALASDNHEFRQPVSLFVRCSRDALEYLLRSRYERFALCVDKAVMIDPPLSLVLGHVSGMCERTVQGNQNGPCY